MGGNLTLRRGVSSYNSMNDSGSYSLWIKMVDANTKKTLATIPLLKTRAGPRDGPLWVDRLKEEYLSLIQVRQGLGEARLHD